MPLGKKQKPFQVNLRSFLFIYHDFLIKFGGKSSLFLYLYIYTRYLLWGYSIRLVLKKRSRAAASKQALMSQHSSIPSPTDKFRKPTSFPKLLTGFTFKSFSETPEAVMSPTSILDSKPFSVLRNPFWPDPNPSPKTPGPETRRHWDKLDSKGIGLGLVDALDDEKTDPSLSKPESRTVLFGSQLKIQIPPFPPSFLSPTDQSPKSPGDFGIKTRNSQLGSFSSGFSPSPVKKSLFGSANSEGKEPSAAMNAATRRCC